MVWPRKRQENKCGFIPAPKEKQDWKEQRDETKCHGRVHKIPSLKNNNTDPLGFFIVVIQSISRVQLLATPWIVACQASLSIITSGSSLKLMYVESVMPQPSRPPLSIFFP